MNRGTKGLEMWCRRQIEGYPGVEIHNMTSSWKNGMAFCALVHHFRPDLIDFDKLNKADVYYNNELAFTLAEKHLGIPALLDAADMAMYDVPDRLSILTYLSQYYQRFASQESKIIKDKSATIASTTPPPQKDEIPQQSNKSNDTTNKPKELEKSTEERKSSSTVDKVAKSTKNTDANKSNAEPQSVANKSKVPVKKSEFSPEKKKKSPASSSASPKVQQKKGNAKENLKSVGKSTTAKRGNEKTKTSPKATVTKAKLNNEVDVNDITKKVKEASIAN